MSEQSKKSALTQELQRLKAKKAAVDDRDIKQALQLRIDALEVELTSEEARVATQEANEKEGASEEDLTPATPEQVRKADELIRQARVEKIRKNNVRVLALMKEAAQVAPNAPAVLESLGDDYNEQKRYKDAATAYHRAMLFSKNNVPLENKYATTVLRSKGMSILDAGYRESNSDPLLFGHDDSPARVGPARIMNAIVPGLGHLVLGKTAAGITLLVLSLIWIVWIASMSKELNALMHMIAGKSTQPNLLVLAPIFGYLITWFIGIASLGTASAPTAKKGPVIRMEPPVNLPFE